MKRLILIRHGKSSWDHMVRDYDRVLLQRGIEDAHLIGKHLKKMSIVPDAIWSSTAARALQTATLVSEYIDYELSSLELKRALYTFDEHELLEVIRSCPDRIDTLMVFSHNHGLTEVANALGNLRIDNVSTTGVVAIDINTTTWKTLHKGTTIFSLFPKNLK